MALGLAPKRCNAAEYSICIEPTGDVLPCQSYYVSAGNILTDSWDYLEQRALPQLPQPRGGSDSRRAPRTVLGLPDLAMCGGGCRLEREAQAGQRAAERGCARSRLPVSVGFTPPPGVTECAVRASGRVTRS
jgi:MoaA/NifB/PqqE/SkfB family radical SAM enzyme